MNAPGPMLPLTQVIREPSDLNSSSYASMFYVSNSFLVRASVSAAVAGRLSRSPHRYRNRICRGRSGPVNGASETVNASEEEDRKRPGHGQNVANDPLRNSSRCTSAQETEDLVSFIELSLASVTSITLNKLISSLEKGVRGACSSFSRSSASTD